jgi:small nuclear ribonucleoprotein (snRNP)-like protein
MAYNNSRNPLRVLAKRIGNPVAVLLKDGTKYTGDLKEYDNFMNIILQNAKEFLRGAEKESETAFPEIFIRGNNVLYIQPEP